MKSSSLIQKEIIYLSLLSFILFIYYFFFLFLFCNFVFFFFISPKIANLIFDLHLNKVNTSQCIDFDVKCMNENQRKSKGQSRINNAEKNYNIGPTRHKMKTRKKTQPRKPKRRKPRTSPKPGVDIRRPRRSSSPCLS